jgi:hypothetical protein
MFAVHDTLVDTEVVVFEIKVADVAADLKRVGLRAKQSKSSYGDSNHPKSSYGDRSHTKSSCGDRFTNLARKFTITNSMTVTIIVIIQNINQFITLYTKFEIH